MVTDWSEVARNTLRAEMVRKGVTTAELARRIGEVEKTVANKISGGKFGAAWLLMCLAAIGAKRIELD
ncbi:hypothetical protein CA606_18270 [Caulobacter vibrioides]|uniref:DUF6471 domain-containing protein n=1 Tax=Caulobacter vibrioides TaxID=155892 RepID=A0A290N0B4_CAUVI|nr:DUF6471 domain-containing protein [Caulobacter vibrioides]ATC34120.1 hypothetical protein CA606_18270 [Caulobacter vibrioides]